MPLDYNMMPAANRYRTDATTYAASGNQPMADWMNQLATRSAAGTAAKQAAGGGLGSLAGRVPMPGTMGGGQYPGPAAPTAQPMMGAPMPVTQPQMGLQPMPAAPAPAPMRSFNQPAPMGQFSQPSPMRSQIASYMGARPSPQRFPIMGANRMRY